MTEIPKDLVEALSKGRVIPFVGAGVSQSVRYKEQDAGSAFPGWMGLMERAVAFIERDAPRTAASIRKMTEDEENDVIDIATHARNEIGEKWGKFIHSTLSVRKTDVDQTSLLVPQMVWGISDRVITTNYDLVLRWACPCLEDVLEFSSTSSNVGIFLDGTVSRPLVWHLHGSIMDPKATIFARGDYESLYGNSGEYEGARLTLRSLLRGHTFLFMGFSLKDPFLLAQLRWVHQAFGGITSSHYVVIPKREKPLFAMNNPLGAHPIVYEDYGAPYIDLLTQITSCVNGAA